MLRLVPALAVTLPPRILHRRAERRVDGRQTAAVAAPVGRGRLAALTGIVGVVPMLKVGVEANPGRVPLMPTEPPLLGMAPVGRGRLAALTGTAAPPLVGPWTVTTEALGEPALPVGTEPPLPDPPPAPVGRPRAAGNVERRRARRLDRGKVPRGADGERQPAIRLNHIASRRRDDRGIAEGRRMRRWRQCCRR